MYLALFVVASKLGLNIQWSSWYDQSHYLRSAEALARGDFSADQHWYPLLYPALIAPFATIGPLAPVPVNTLCFAAAGTAFVAVCRQVYVGAVAALFIFVATTLLIPGFEEAWFWPWTSTPAAALFWISTALLTAIVRGDGAANRHPAALAACLAAIPMARYGDAVIALALGAVFSVWALRRRAWHSLFTFSLTGSVLSLGYLAVHLWIYGGIVTDYVAMISSYGADWSELPFKAYVLLVDYREWFVPGHSLIAEAPWLIVAIAGSVVALTGNSSRLPTLLIAAASTPYLLTMLAFIDLLPTGLAIFGSLHYFKMLMPAAGLFAWIWLVRAPRQPLLAAGSVLGVIALLSIRPVPVQVETGDYRLAIFAAKTREYQHVLFGRSTASDAIGKQRNISDFRQILFPPDAVAILALRRDFSGDLTWQWFDPNGGWVKGWLGSKDGKPVVPHAQTASFRFARSWQFSPPCWLPLRRCATPVADAVRKVQGEALSL